MAGLTNIPIGQILTPPAGDLGQQAIDTLLPIMQQPNGDVGVSQNLMGVLLSYVGWITMALMGVVAIANLVNLALTTSQTGYLDRRANWKGIIRWTMAFILALPLLNGFAAVDGFIYTGMVWGDGLAANAYQALIQAIGPNATPIFQPVIPGTIKTIAGIVEAEMCRAIANAAGNNPNLVPEPAPITGGAAGGDRYVVWAYRLSNGNATGAPACGTVTLHQTAPVGPGVADISQKRITILTGIIGQINAGVAPIAQNLWNTRQTASLTPLQALVVNEANAYAQQLTAAAQAATAAIRAEFPEQSMRTGTIAMPNGIPFMQTLGWVTAPAWYVYLSYLDGLTISATLATPSVAPPSYQGFGGTLSADMANLIAASTNHLTDIMTFSSTQDRTDAPAGYGDLRSMETPADDGAGLVERVLRALNVNDKMLRLFVSQMSPVSANIVDPFGQLISLGQFMLTTAIVMLGASMFLASSTGTAALTAWNLLTLNVGGAIGTVAGHALFSAFSMPIFMITMALLVPGATLAYLLPLTPAAIWLFGIINWLTRFAILVIAAPFWMFAHITLDDSGFTSRGIHGWYEFVAVFFKPIFMLAGFMLAFPIFAFGAWLCTLMFYILAGFIMGGGNLVTNFIGLILDLSAFVLEIIALAVASFQLITIVPQKAQELLGMISANAFDASTLGQDIALNRTTLALQNVRAGIDKLTNATGPKQIAAENSAINSNIAAASTP